MFFFYETEDKISIKVKMNSNFKKNQPKLKMNYSF